MKLTSILLTALAVASTAAFAQNPAAQPSSAQVTSALTPQAGNEHPLLPIGSPAPTFSLQGTDGKTYTSADFSKDKLLVVMFESIHCPVSENYEGRMRGLYDAYHGKGVGFVAINPNNPKAVRLDELGYTDLTDSPADMKIRVKDRNIPWPYLYDGDTQAVAQKFGAVATPHRPAFGCSTKWLAKAGDVRKEAARIDAEPVTLTPSTPADLRALRANAGNKVTVVHFWNTATPGGTEDFPELQTTYFMYRGRAYDFVTVNTDSAASTAKATEYLRSQHASSRNLQIAPADLKAAQTAFGSTWAPNEEYTAVIAPGGKVVYAHKGPINILDVRHAVLGNFTDNPYFPGQAEYWAERKGQ